MPTKKAFLAATKEEQESKELLDEISSGLNNRREIAEQKLL